jgi:hypothetical protein
MGFSHKIKMLKTQFHKSTYVIFVIVNVTNRRQKSNLRLMEKPDATDKFG